MDSCVLLASWSSLLGSPWLPEAATALTMVALEATTATATAEGPAGVPLEDLGVPGDADGWGSAGWKAEVLSEVLDTFLSEGEVGVSPSVLLLAEALVGEGSADLEDVDVEALKLLVSGGLVGGNDKNTVLEEGTENLGTNSSWHPHGCEKDGPNRY